MDDEYIRSKYRYMYDKVYRIKDKLTDVDDVYSELMSSLEEALIVDGEVPNNEKLKSIEKSIMDIKHEINNVVLPRIVKKM